ncbi:MAG: hypothetical protein WAL32_16605 [Terriglobales bacterium]
MTFLIDLGVLLGVTVVVVVIWGALVFAILRMLRIPVAFGVGKERREANFAVIRGLGRRKYVFIVGVLLWGWPVFLPIQVSGYVTNGHLGTGGFWPSAMHRVIGLLIWSAGGAWFGLWMWKKRDTLNPTD